MTTEEPRLIGSGLAVLEQRDGIGIITLNRPDKRNAMNLAAQRDLAEALELARHARVIVLTGAPPAFCAGIDLVEQRMLRASNAHVPTQDGHPWAATQERIRRHHAVFIAAVGGVALGGGLTLVHNCELAIADESAEFGMPELTFGSVPALSGPSTVRRLLPKHSAQLIFLAERVSAATALHFGIVNEVVPDGQALKRAIKMAEVIAGYDPVALEHTKKLFRETADLSWPAAINRGVALGALARAERAQSATNSAADAREKEATGSD
jgi:enoyl-CoA hydratase/carnithine racemase